MKLSTLNEIKYLNKHLKNEHTAGYDDILVSYMKTYRDPVLDFMTYIVNNPFKYDVLL